MNSFLSFSFFYKYFLMYSYSYSCAFVGRPHKCEYVNLCLQVTTKEVQNPSRYLNTTSTNSTQSNTPIQMSNMMIRDLVEFFFFSFFFPKKNILHQLKYTQPRSLSRIGRAKIILSYIRDLTYLSYTFTYGSSHPFRYLTYIH